MYIPKANAETRLPVLTAMIAAHPLAAVVTTGSDGLVATHMPLAHEQDGSEYGVLRGHIARANSQWSTASLATEALVIFSGPQHYISPNWYPSKALHGKAVPTWNYVVVHAYGRLRVIHDADWLLGLLDRLTRQNESPLEKQWNVADAPPGYIDGMLQAIVGFEIPIRKLEGKWKVSQSLEAGDRPGVIDHLDALDTPAAHAISALIPRG